MNIQLDTKTICGDDFLLLSDTAAKLYHEYAKDLPIIDYHNHLPPKEISTNKKFGTLTEIWLKGDHYKWRAMRNYGVGEEYITGSVSDEGKFNAWANVVPYTVRNPLFHWTHMELKKPFGLDTYLDSKSAAYIYGHCNDLLQQDNFSTRSILKQFNVETLGTTDDPCDLLLEHQQLKNEEKDISVLPSFRPDNIFNVTDRASWLIYIQRLANVSGINITSADSLLAALKTRIDYFHQHGCRVSDHGLEKMPSCTHLSIAQETELKAIINGSSTTVFSDPEAFTGFLLFELCKFYHEKGWVQQFHLGAIRNVNTRMSKLIGAETGFDSIGDFKHAQRLASFLNELDKTDQLCKTIIYNLNPADNEIFAAMTGNYSTGAMKGKVQFGAAWWFLDQKDGIVKQLNALSNLGLVSTFIGMLTDSRSFLSYSRHEYFRRILCNIFAEDIGKGELPNDLQWMGSIIADICYYNVKNYLNIDETVGQLRTEINDKL